MAKAKKQKILPIPTKFPDISERFKKFKEGTGLTFEELSEALLVNKQNLQAYCTPRVSPNYHVLRMLKKNFGLSYDWLIDGETDGIEIDDALRKLDEIGKTLRLLRARSK